MKHRLLLLLLTFTCLTAFGQTFGPWKDGANGLQYRWKYNSPTDSVREFRHLVKSPQLPFAITDTINKVKDTLNSAKLDIKKRDYLSTGLIAHASLSATVGQTT